MRRLTASLTVALAALMIFGASPALAEGGAVVTPDATGLQVDADAKAVIEEAYSALAAGRFADAARAFGALADGGAGPDASYLEGLAWYEAGELRLASAALEDQARPEAWNLLGLVRIDSGEQAEGEALLSRARAEGAPAVASRATLNLAVVRLDQGRLSEAELLLGEGCAAAAGDPSLAEACAVNAGVLAARKGEGAGGEGTAAPLDEVADALRRGAWSSAEATIQQMMDRAVTRKARVELGLAQGSLLRARGQPDAAVAVLSETLIEARSGGLARETAQALASLGVAHALAGRQDLALTLLAEAEATARAGGYLASAVDYGAEAALIALRQGQVEVATQRLAALQSSLDGMTHPMGRARVNELAGGIAAANGDLAGAQRGFGDALRWHESKGHYSDAARVATSLMATEVELDGPKAEATKARAEALFSQAGDPLGPAHIALAWGLARARAKDLPGALEAFSEAREAAAPIAGAHARFVAQTAELNAARALVALGASEDAARLAAAEGLEAAMSHNAALAEAMSTYEEGLAAYDAGRYAEARRHFRGAADGFAAAGEGAYAKQAKGALAWSAFNLAVGLSPEEAFPFWGELIAQAQQLEESELVARATAAAAMDARELGMDGDGARLSSAATLALKGGLPHLAASCYAALAEGSGALPSRADAARRALALAPEDMAAVYAMYSVAVDAYNADEMDLAAALAAEVLPHAGELREAAQEVLTAAGG